MLGELDEAAQKNKCAEDKAALQNSLLQGKRDPAAPPFQEYLSITSTRAEGRFQAQVSLCQFYVYM